MSGVTTATIISGVAAAGSLASAGMSIIGGLQGNQSGAASTAWANQMNMQMAQRSAAIARDRARSDASDIEASTRRTLASIRANAGASGLLVDEGSPLETVIASAGAGELNKQRRLWEGELEAQDAEIGGVAAQRTFTPSYTGIASGGAQLLTGVSRVRDLLNTRGRTDGPYGGPTAPRPD